MRRQSNSYIDFQQRSRLFDVGDEVVSCYNPNSMSGVIVAKWPAIGMVDVSFPYGVSRVPVEEIQLVDDQREPDGVLDLDSTIPGGLGTYPVSAGPSAKRVASRYVKALYWAAPDRKYRVTKRESDDGCYCCPRCSENLTKRLYKIDGGVRDYIFTCPSCTFVVHGSDLIVGE